MSTRRRLAVSLAATAAVAGAVSLVVGTVSSSAAPAPAGCPTDGSYYNTIPAPVGPPTAVSYYNESHPHYVGYNAIGADSRLYASYTDIYEGFDPDELYCLGGQATDAPGVFEYGGDDENLAVFVRAANGKLYQRYITGDYTSTGPYTVVNDAASTNGPAALEFGGQFHLFVRGTNGALYHGFRAEDGTNSSWRFEKVGGAIVGSPTAVVDGNRMLVSMAGTNGSIYTVAGTNFAWGPFTKVVNQVEGNTPTQITTKTPPSLVRNMETGEITMYAASSTYGLFSLTKSASAGFTGRRWVRIDSVLPSDARISAGVNVHNDTVVYARFLDRPSGHILTAYTQFSSEDPQAGFSDYYLAPYTCANCAPYDVSDSNVLKGASVASSAKDGKKSEDGTVSAAAVKPHRTVVLDSNKTR